MVQIVHGVWLVTKEEDLLAGPVENYWGKKDNLWTTQSHLLTQCSHPHSHVDYTEQLTQLPQHILTSHFGT